MKKKKTPNLIRGTMVMIVSMIVTKVLGAAYNIPLSRILSNEGMGIYSNAYALYAILLTLTTAGFPSAMGKYISEEAAVGNYNEIERIYRNTMKIVTFLSVLFFFLMWIGAPYYSQIIDVHEGAYAAKELTRSIKVLSFCLLIVPFVSAYRGYLQGFQKMEPSGISQAVEQLFRVLFMITGVYIAFKTGKDIATQAAIATSGGVVGSIASIIVLWIAIVPLRRENALRQVYTKGDRQDEIRIVKKMFHYAIPISMGTLVVPISGFIDSVTIQNILSFHGYNLQESMSLYGVLSRKALPLIQLPLAFAMAIGSSILPAISSHSAKKEYYGIIKKVSISIRVMMFISFPMAATFLLLSAPIDLILFGNTRGSYIISSVSFIGIFSSLELISTYALQGMGKMYIPVKNMFFGIAVKLILNIILIYFLGIIGAAIASTVGYIVSSTLNFYSAKKETGISLKLYKLYHPFITATLGYAAIVEGVAYAFRYIFKDHFPMVHAITELVFSMGMGGTVYFLLIVYTKIITKEELKMIPFLGKWIKKR